MTLQSILGNFSLILFILTIVTGVIWFLDVFYFAKQRRKEANVALAEFDAQLQPNQSARFLLEAKILRQPTWIEYSGSFFPVIALVFFLRSFLYEPFKIPTSSMVPTLHVGDLILVNKYSYGVRLPIINQKIIEVGNPQRGDVMVFKYPKDMSMDYIKRVVGVPGDKIVYKNKHLEVNGEKLSYESLPDHLDEESLRYLKQYSENLIGKKHSIVLMGDRPAYVPDPESFPGRENCTYDAEGFACSVPAGQYFMMGDNRDNSRDSRYWGFVPDKNIVGKAFFVWMNLGNLNRIGSFQ